MNSINSIKVDYWNALEILKDEVKEKSSCALKRFDSIETLIKEDNSEDMDLIYEEIRVLFLEFSQKDKHFAKIVSEDVLKLEKHLFAVGGEDMLEFLMRNNSDELATIKSFINTAGLAFLQTLDSVTDEGDLLKKEKELQFSEEVKKLEDFIHKVTRVRNFGKILNEKIATIQEKSAVTV